MTHRFADITENLLAAFMANKQISEETRGDRNRK